MTKADMIKMLANLPDDAEIFIHTKDEDMVYDTHRIYSNTIDIRIRPDEEYGFAMLTKGQRNRIGQEMKKAMAEGEF